MNLNKVQLIGRLGKKPEVNYIQPDVPVARFSVATSESYKNKAGERVDTTEWHNIVAWRNTAKFAENYLDKGMLVYIEGKLQTRKWDAQDGTTKYSTEIITDQIKILEKRADGSQQTKPQEQFNQVENSTPAQQVAETAFDPIDDALKSDIEDDLPF